jgi:hypothetical protein
MVQELRAKYRANPNDPIAASRLVGRLIDDAEQTDCTSVQDLLVEANKILTSARVTGLAKQMPDHERQLQKVAALEYGAATRLQRAAAARRVEQAQENLRSAAPSLATDSSAADAVDRALEAIRREGPAFKEQYLDAVLTRAESRAARDIHAVNDDVISVLGSNEALANRDLARRALHLARAALEQGQNQPQITAVVEHLEARRRVADSLETLRQLADDLDEQILANPSEPVLTAARIEVLAAQMSRLAPSGETGMNVAARIARAINGLRTVVPARALSSEQLARLSEVAATLPDVEPLRIEKERLHFFCVRSLEDRTTAPARDHNVRHLWLRALQRLALHQQATNHPDAPETLELCEAPA